MISDKKRSLVTEVHNERNASKTYGFLPLPPEQALPLFRRPEILSLRPVSPAHDLDEGGDGLLEGRRLHGVLLPEDSRDHVRFVVLVLKKDAFYRNVSILALLLYECIEVVEVSDAHRRLPVGQNEQ